MTNPTMGPATRRSTVRPALVAGAIGIFVFGLMAGAGTGWVTGAGAVAGPLPATSSVTSDPPAPSGTETTEEPAPSATASTDPPSTSTDSPSTSPFPTASAGPSKAERERQARTELEELAAKGYALANPSGQVVAQLSSKYIGIKDKLQTAKVSGGHTFRAVDIVAEYEDTRAKVEEFGATAVLIKGSDIEKGRQQDDGRLFWYVFVLDFSSKSEVKSWCAGLYPRLSGRRLENRCVATNLKP